MLCALIIIASNKLMTIGKSLYTLIIKIMLVKYISITVVSLLLISNNLLAQDNNQNSANTLFKNTKSINTDKIGYFIAPKFGLTEMDGSSTSLLNLRGGLSFNDKISFGGYFSTSINEINPQSETLDNVYMDYWSVGGFAEYTLFSKKVFHLTLPLYLGYGEVQMDNESGDASLGESNFFQIEPSALLEVNLNQHIRINLGAGYRFVGDMEYRNFNQSDISGVTGYLGLKFGLFK